MMLRSKPGVLATPHTMDDPAIKDSEVPLAVVGIVLCKVTAENGPIGVGDLLVTPVRGTPRKAPTAARCWARRWARRWSRCPRARA